MKPSLVKPVAVASPPKSGGVTIVVDNAADYAPGSKHTVGDATLVVVRALDKTHVLLSTNGEES